MAAPARVRVILPADVAAIPSLRGSAAPLRWDRGQPMDRVAPGTFEWSVSALAAPAEFKVLLGDTTWSLGQNYRLTPGQTVEVCPRFTPQPGAFARRWPDGSQTPLGDRGVWIYTPPGLRHNPGCRYPVLYMHDGQNLFDPRAAFGGVTWRVAETLDAGANATDPAQALPEVIVVGVENAGAARLTEYTPVPDPMYGGGGGDVYLRFLTRTVKPFIDRTLPTRPEAAATALIGSSLGGLITAHAGLRHADTFQRLGVLSPSTWWAGRWLVAQVRDGAARSRVARVYVDSGDSGPSMDGAADTRLLAEAYRAAGYRDDLDLLYVVQAGAEHSERFWAARLPGALRFLLKDL